jgi:hypothetical protein
MRPFQGKGTSRTLSGGVAPGYYPVPLQGMKKAGLGSYPSSPVSDVDDGGHRRCRLRARIAEAVPPGLDNVAFATPMPEKWAIVPTRSSVQQPPTPPHEGGNQPTTPLPEEAPEGGGHNTRPLDTHMEHNARCHVLTTLFSITFPQCWAKYLCFQAHSRFVPEFSTPGLCFHRHSRFVRSVFEVTTVARGRRAMT